MMFPRTRTIWILIWILVIFLLAGLTGCSVKAPETRTSVSTEPALGDPQAMETSGQGVAPAEDETIAREDAPALRRLGWGRGPPNCRRNTAAS